MPYKTETVLNVTPSKRKNPSSLVSDKIDKIQSKDKGKGMEKAGTAGSATHLKQPSLKVGSFKNNHAQEEALTPVKDIHPNFLPQNLPLGELTKDATMETMALPTLGQKSNEISNQDADD